MAQHTYYSLKPDIEAAVKQARGPSEPFPWGFGSGLLSGCVITLFGVATNMDQLTIMTRASVGGASIGLVVALVSLALRNLSPATEEE